MSQVSGGEADYLTHGEFKEYKIAYDKDIMSEKVVASITRGSYERYEGRNGMRLIQDGDRVLECGAGLGFISSLLMTKKHIAEYHLVEADKRLFPLMKRTHQLNNVNGNVVMHNYALTEDDDELRAGAVTFSLGQKFCGSSTKGAANSIGEVSVPTRSLRDFLKVHRVNAIICDIEGAEVDLFDGSELPGVEKIMMETHPERIGLDGIRRLIRNLDRAGFVYDGLCSAGVIMSFRYFR